MTILKHARMIAFVLLLLLAVYLLFIYQGFSGSPFRNLTENPATPIDAVTSATLYARAPFDEAQKSVREAMWYEKLPGDKVLCTLCPRRCELADGEVGKCLTRFNRDGRLYTKIFGRTAIFDAKLNRAEYPLTLRGFPDVSWTAVGLTGCPLRCAFCVFGDVVQSSPDNFLTVPYDPEKVADEAAKKGSIALSYTFNEPTNSFEFTYELMKAAKARGMGNVLGTSGYVSKEPLAQLAPYMDAAVIGLKSFNPASYRRYTSGSLETIKENMKLLHDMGVVVEIDYLVIPTISDNMDDITKMAEWLKTNIGPDTNVHFLRYYPQFRLKNLPSPPNSVILDAVAAAKKGGLTQVFILDWLWAQHAKENIEAVLPAVRCPNCGKVLYQVTDPNDPESIVNNLELGHCKFCKTSLGGLPSVIERLVRERAHGE